MSWEYEVSTAKFYKNGIFEYQASYAGAPGYKNDSAFECVKDNGPVPRGRYAIGSPYNSAYTGSYTLSLNPNSRNNMCGRFAFKIHGDSKARPGLASNGCIVAPLAVRQKIWLSGDRELIVR